jgi:hypothetical protein
MPEDEQCRRDPAKSRGAWRAANIAQDGRWLQLTANFRVKSLHFLQKETLIDSQH